MLLVGGNNIYGQCARPQDIGIGGETLSQNLKVAQLRLEGYMITDIAAGSYHSLIIADYGKSKKLMGFGHELGCGFLDRVHRHNPTTILSDQIPESDPAVKVFAGRMRSAVLLRSGKIKMWGEWYNGAKQRALRNVDIDIRDDRIKKIVMGQFHSLFLTDKGKVFSWGDNTYGELGVGASHKWKANPEQIPFFDGKNCIDCDVGGRHSLVLEANGNLYSFGDNSEGQCGIEVNRTYEPTLIETRGMLGEDNVLATHIFAGDAHSALVTNEGDLFAWGDNSEERLGIHTSSSIFRPTLVEDVMGRNLCAVGLGGFFSVFVTGQKEYAIGRKNLSEQKTNKIFKSLMFGNLNLTGSKSEDLKPENTLPEVKKTGLFGLPKLVKNEEETKSSEKHISFGTILKSTKSEEVRTEKN